MKKLSPEEVFAIYENACLRIGYLVNSPHLKGTCSLDVISRYFGGMDNIKALVTAKHPQIKEFIKPKVIKICSKEDCGKKLHAHGLCSHHNYIKRYKEQSAYSKNYEKTSSGFLMRAYRNMKSRVLGIQKKNWHLYKGKELLDKDAFYIWAKADKDFWALFKAWKMSGHNQKLTPSVNRIDSNKGYTLDNMEWITNSQNSGLSSITKLLKNKERSVIYATLGIKIEKD